MCFLKIYTFNNCKINDMSQSILFMCARSAKENLISTLFNYRYNYKNNHLYVLKKKHQMAYIIIEKGRTILRFFLKLLNLWLIILTIIHKLISFSILKKFFQRRYTGYSYQIWKLVRSCPGSVSACSLDLELSFCHKLKYSNP